MHLSSNSVGFCFLCSNVEVTSDKLITSLLQVTLVPSQEGPPNSSCVVLPRGLVAAAWSSTDVACEHERGESHPP